MNQQESSNENVISEENARRLSETRRKIRKIGSFIKAIVGCLFLAVVCILIFRMISSADPKSVKTISVNDNLLSAYETYGEELSLCYQDQASTTRTDKNYGYFAVTRSLFILEANQVQLVFRYNNSTLEHLQEDYSLTEAPKSGTYYDVTLYITYQDKTREDVRIHASANVVRDETRRYTYFRYTFDGVDLTGVEGVFADIYYLGDLDYENAPYGALCLYDYTDKWIDYRLTSADKKALSEAK